MNPVKNFRVLYKISLIIAIVSVPVAILSALFFDFKTDAVEFAEKEITGVEYIQPAQDVLKHVAAHRSMVAAAQQNSAIRNKLSAKQGEVDVAIRAVSQVDTQTAAPLGVSNEWSSIESQWLNLRNGVSRMSVQESAVAHDRLVGNILSFIESVGDASNLILDPVLDSYYLMDSIVIKLPAVQSEIESLRSQLASKQKGVALTNHQLLEIKVYLKQIEKGLIASRRSLEVAFENNAGLKGPLEASLNRFINESQGYASYVASLHKDSSDSEYRQAFNRADSVISSWDVLSDAVAAELTKVLENRVSDSKSELYIDMSLVMVCIFIALACGIWVIRSITKPMAQVIEIFHKIEEGDLSSKIEVKTTEETGKMLQALSNMQTSLGIFDDVTKMLSAMAAGDMSSRINVHCQGKFKELQHYANELAEKFGDVVGTIQESAHSVKTTADEISEGNNNLSKRTESQAASLEQTAASMEEVTGTIVQNTENARQANQLASEATDTAKVGGDVVDTAITAMSGINESSQKIADIISVIDEIAFQTNLLALNASVEAARAGEQGRGFAVVAGEVRNLAGRSATSAKEIKELIEDSVSKVEEGSRLVNQSGENLAEIVASVKKVSDIVAEITAASEEQAIGIEEINRSITKIDEVTQQNTALVEEVAAASESMGSEAADLETQMRFFTIGEGRGGVRSAAKPQARQAERRQPDRAWSDSESSSPASDKAEPPVLKAVGGDDDFWEEF